MGTISQGVVAQGALKRLFVGHPPPQGSLKQHVVQCSRREPTVPVATPARGKSLSLYKLVV